MLKRDPLKYYKVKDLVPFTVRVHADLYRWLVQHSIQKGESMSKVVWRALWKYRRQQIRLLSNPPNKIKSN
jgi:hypothetical protein